MEEYSEKNIKELENQLLSKIGNFSTRKKDAIQYENSLIKEINTTSNQLLAIERSFDFEVENSPVEKKPPSDGSDLL